jgi:hypothetical protein
MDRFSKISSAPCHFLKDYAIFLVYPCHMRQESAYFEKFNDFNDLLTHSKSGANKSMESMAYLLRTIRNENDSQLAHNPLKSLAFSDRVVYCGAASTASRSRDENPGI